MIILELCLFETGKDYFPGDCKSGCHFYLQWNSSSLLFYVFHSSGALVLKHQSPLQLSWLLNMCSRETLLDSLNYSIFSIFFFIIYPQSLFSRRASALVHPHRWALILLTTENMCLATTFTWWEGSASKDGSDIYSSSFPLYDFRTWPRAHLDVCSSKSYIVLS